MEKEVFSPNDDHTNHREKANTITCPRCSKSVTLVPYGNGWVGTCCGMVVYNETFARYIPIKLLVTI